MAGRAWVSGERHLAYILLHLPGLGGELPVLPRQVVFVKHNLRPLGDGVDVTLQTPIALDRDVFMRRLISSLGYLNESILGSDIAGAYIMNVGLSMGAAIEQEYKRAWGIDRPFTVDEYAHVIVDLKQRIQGNFSLVYSDDDKVVVQTTSCPFDEFVRQSPSLCFMTSSVFGGIAARNFGYGKTALQQRIALGDPGCYVTVFLRRTPEAEASIGKEYYPDVERASPDIGEQLRLMNSVRRLREELSTASSRWEEVVRGALEAICVLDRQGHVTFANASWRVLLGVEGEELVGSLFERIVHPDDVATALEAVDDAMRGRRITRREWRLKDRETNWRDVAASLAPVRDEAGQIVGIIGIFQDITEEREAQRLKDELLTTASHELRTPVTTIKGLTEVLLRSLEMNRPIAPEQLAHRLQIIHKAADRLALLSADLVDVARLQSGRLPLPREVHDLNTIVEHAVALQRERVEGLGHHTLVVFATQDHLPVSVEPRRVEQALTNLLDNAIKYSPNGGEIVITTERAGYSCRVSIADSGIGVPARDIPNLFSPFYRASNVSSRNYDGLGFGLYLSREIVTAHGGDLAVQSAEGRGSTFTISLPLADSPVDRDMDTNHA